MPYKVEKSDAADTGLGLGCAAVPGCTCVTLGRHHVNTPRLIVVSSRIMNAGGNQPFQSYQKKTLTCGMDSAWGSGFDA